MEVEQSRWTVGGGWEGPAPALRAEAGRSLGLVFGSRRLLAEPSFLAELRRRHGGLPLLGCSTAGEIFGTEVSDDTVVVTAIRFADAVFVATQARLGFANERETGRRLAANLPKEGLVHLLVLSVGHRVNATALVAGISSGLPASVGVTGGLAGDGEQFGETLVLWDEPVHDGVVAVGLYGRGLRVGCGSLGGFEPFGPERWVTRSHGSVLYDLDGESALGLYKRYLGSKAEDLPASALLFPLEVRTSIHEPGVARTVLAVDEESQSMTFAGEIPVGARVRLMKTTRERLIDGAARAVASSRAGLGEGSADLALLISCVGRRLALRHRVEEELDAARTALGSGTTLAGFYSYGEISPLIATAGPCGLHNQTMTATTFREI